MLKIEKVDTNSKAEVRRFVKIPYRLFAQHPQWVPPLFGDAELQLNNQKHPYYEHSFAEFFIASRDGHDVGRIAALEYTRYNNYHKLAKLNFTYLSVRMIKKPPMHCSSECLNGRMNGN